MKSNEERVRDIIGKAKAYRSKRAKVLSGSAFFMCAVIAVVVAGAVGARFNGGLKMKNDNGNVIGQNDILVVREDSKENIVEEISLACFESKEELVGILKEKAKENNRWQNITFGELRY